jgi:anaerobic ribonucleoside-triphosphate reductase activating protein
MFYSAYHSVDVINGEGTRCTLFVSGCEHACKGCYNQATWRLNAGHYFTQALEDKIISDLQDERINRDGLSLSGGDPFHPNNLSAVLNLIKRVKKQCPTKNIWLWTGYRLTELSQVQRHLLEYIDVLVDGKFVQSLADPALIWRGSSNQVVHRLS